MKNDSIPTNTKEKEVPTEITEPTPENSVEQTPTAQTETANIPSQYEHLRSAVLKAIEKKQTKSTKKESDVDVFFDTLEHENTDTVSEKEEIKALVPPALRRSKKQLKHILHTTQRIAGSFFQNKSSSAKVTKNDTSAKKSEVTEKNKTQKKAPTAEVTSPSTKKTTQVFDTQGLLLFGLNLLITLVLLGGITVGVLGYGVYKGGLDTVKTATVAHYIPYPAGIVNGHVLTVSEFRRQVAALNQYFAVSDEDEVIVEEYNRTLDVQEIVWERFVYNTLLSELADQYNLGVNEDLLQEQMNAIVAESGSIENFEARIAFLYGWDVETFKKLIVEPFVLQEVVSARIFRDESLRQERKDLIVSLRNQILENPDRFSEFAREYSEDLLTKSLDGTMGIFAEGTLSSELDAALVNMQPGEVSEVIETGEGYEILQLVGRYFDEVKPTQVEVKRILIRYPTFELLMQEKQKQATIYRFVR